MIQTVDNRTIRIPGALEKGLLVQTQHNRLQVYVYNDDTKSSEYVTSIGLEELDTMKKLLLDNQSI